MSAVNGTHAGCSLDSSTWAGERALRFELTLTPEQLDVLADLVAARLAERQPAPPVEMLGASPAPHRLVDAVTLAGVLGVSRDCVYDHADELGGERIGSGPRGRLRFDLDRALEAWTAGSAGPILRSAGP